MTALQRLIRDEDGGLFVETALLLFCCSMACYLAFQALGGGIAGHATRVDAAFHQNP